MEAEFKGDTAVGNRAGRLSRAHCTEEDAHFKMMRCNVKSLQRH